MIKIKGHTFEHTKFPDGTSQIWKLNPEPKRNQNYEVLWQFENESEFMAILQIGMLLETAGGLNITLKAPFFPYARQDKRISNDATFAKETIVRHLKAAGYTRVETFDLHSKQSMAVMSYPPTEFHKSILNHDFICYPDAGAMNRYIMNHPSIYAEKVRNQSTGVIESLKLNMKADHTLQNKTVLIVDDLCDGGATFINLAKELQKHNPTAIDLAVSHGLFTKGKQILHDAGIRNIYTTNSVLTNVEGYDVIGKWE